jgi:TetR/AcrR family transcriptional regulator, transcriptional repressor for nem operon
VICATEGRDVTANHDGPAVRTAARILDVAERLVQTRGFNGFSYADVAAELKITKAALHYHFPGKGELGEALIARYADRFMAAFRVLDDTSGTALTRIDGYVDLHAGVLSLQKMCLCGMLAAEYQTLSAPMQSAVTKFFGQHADWLERVLEQGSAEGSLTFSGPARDTALMIISVLEGAMLVARPYGGIETFRATAAGLLSGLDASPAAEPRPA